jgi:hypothetical protein
MAKKTSKSATKAKKATETKAAKKKAAAKKDEAVEITLDAVETKAIELVDSSDKVCEELEKAVTSAVTEVVRKVFKKNRISLTAAQAEKVALVLFSD